MKFIAPSKLLAFYSLINIVLIIAAVTLKGMPAVYALLGVEFFMSIMFPTIFSLSMQKLGSRMKLGSSLVIMAIVGGAVFPVIMGMVSDQTNIHTAYIVPAVCFAVVFYFALTNLRAKDIKLSTAH